MIKHSLANLPLQFAHSFEVFSQNTISFDMLLNEKSGLCNIMLKFSGLKVAEVRARVCAGEVTSAVAG
ncbi:hypothetical protein SADUNF_Sadunf16G0018200 [Salix dunnii]|uniref:Uncharacterized protein n=1 Tax=Salix dunnii TaxID=1413687 RepID=A0A835MKM6_9ROSI|nr:hypothetical protein SADUNF_Sadunf16G0018200 [Salix dunnii]